MNSTSLPTTKTMERLENMDQIAKKAVLYCRVSDKKQRNEGHGLDSQEHRCREYAESRG
jgi:predicted site-specific integrase-resolvase